VDEKRNPVVGAKIVVEAYNPETRQFNLIEHHVVTSRFFYFHCI
jgi:hypothetical protein